MDQQLTEWITMPGINHQNNESQASLHINFAHVEMENYLAPNQPHIVLQIIKYAQSNETVKGLVCMKW